jgi:tRNA U34 2-thiouridine synthase MnmA/TrmU
MFDISIDVIDISREYLEVLRHPKYGYGKNMNPCIDCRIMTMAMARDIMEESGASFVYSGEVLGQRPMSQHRPSLRLIEKESGLEDRLLRPLSAKLLPETEPERLGLVDRSRLMAFSGRSRKPQYALAHEYGYDNLPQPAGGCCLLTDPVYGRKLKDLFDHKNPDDCGLTDLLLLKVGRHLRVSSGFKVVVGRDEHENRFIDANFGHLTRLEAVGVMGPVVIAEGSMTPDNLECAAGITARYSDGKDRPELDIRYRINGEEKVMTVKPLAPDEVAEWVIQ